MFPRYPLAAVLVSAAVALAAQCPDGIVVHDGGYRSPRGFLGFAPEHVDPDAAPLSLVVFLHGYGGINPLNYGAWLRAIVEDGAVVVYPRYQRNLLVPGSRRFADHAAEAVRAGVAWAADLGVAVDTSRLVYVGHSYGGAISANLMARERELGLPPAAGAVLAAPGTSRLRGSRLDDYSAISPTSQVLIVSHGGDYVVGDEFAHLLYATLPASAKTAWWRQAADGHPDTTLALALGEGHNEAYALDHGFDTGYRNYTTRKALRIGRVDPVDTLVYWPLTTQLLAATRRDAVHPALARTDGPRAYGMGTWPDGTPRHPLELVRRDSLPSATSRPGAAEPARATPAEATTRKGSGRGRR